MYMYNVHVSHDCVANSELVTSLAAVQCSHAQSFFGKAKTINSKLSRLSASVFGYCLL